MNAKAHTFADYDLHTVSDLQVRDTHTNQWIFAGPGQMAPICMGARNLGWMGSIQRWASRRILGNTPKFDYRFRLMSVLSTVEENSQARYFAGRPTHDAASKDMSLVHESLMGKQKTLNTTGSGSGLRVYSNCSSALIPGVHYGQSIGDNDSTLYQSKLPLSVMEKAMHRNQVCEQYPGRIVPAFYQHVPDNRLSVYDESQLVQGMDLGDSTGKTFVKLPIPFILDRFDNVLKRAFPDQKNEINNNLISYANEYEMRVREAAEMTHDGRIYIGISPDTGLKMEDIVYKDKVSVDAYVRGQFRWNVRGRIVPLNKVDPYAHLDVDRELLYPWMNDSYEEVEATKVNDKSYTHIRSV